MEKRGLPTEGIVLTAMLQKNAVARDDSVILELSMHNEGLQPQRFVASDPFIDYSLIIQNDKGQVVLPSKPIDIQIRSGGSMMLSPNNSISTVFPIQQVYDLSAIGMYRITAMFRIFTPDAQHQSEVVSNTVILTVSNNLSKDFFLTSSLKKPVVAPGTPIVLELNLMNIATTAKTVAASETGSEYTLTVQDFRGDVLPLKKDATSSPNGSKLKPQTLQRGDSAQSTLRVDTLYDLSREGRYVITAMRHVPAGKGKHSAVVYANTVVVTVKKTAQAAGK